jgi:hypothetical protein
MATHRPKSTLRTKYPRAWWTGEYAKPSDNDLPADLANLIAIYRCMAWRLDEEPPRRDIRATLAELADMDDKTSATYWRHLAQPVRAQIDRVHYQEFRRQFGSDVTYSRRLGYYEKGPNNIPKLARLALETMPSDSGGRPRVAHVAMLFCIDLALYWWRTTGKKPRAYVSPTSQSDFMRWAVPLLARADFKTGDAPTILRAAVRATFKPKKPRIADNTLTG